MHTMTCCHLMKLKLLLFLPVFLILTFVSGFISHAQLSEDEVPENDYYDLQVPTYATKVKDTYFIVDCYHNQVIYSKDMKTPLLQWKVLTKDVNQPHTIASDGIVYLIDDTENNRVLVFEKNKKDGFTRTQTLEGIGNRPHFIAYDPATISFYVWSSTTGEMYIMKREDTTNRVFLSEVRQVKALAQTYVRSFTIIDKQILFSSGTNSCILAVNKKTFEIQNRYPVPDNIAGMAQVYPIGKYYYITVSTDKLGNQDCATILRTTDLSSLAKGQYEDLHHYFGDAGTPYYISRFDGSYYLTNHRTPEGLWRFHVNGNAIQDAATVH